MSLVDDFSDPVFCSWATLAFFCRQVTAEAST